MRLILGVAGRAVFDTVTDLTPPPGASVLTVRDLAPEGLPASRDGFDPKTRIHATEIFQQSRLPTIVEIGEPGTWALADCLLEAAPDAKAVFIYPAAGQTIARRLQGGDSDVQALEVWRAAVDEMLGTYRRHRRSVIVVDGASVAAAPDAFQVFMKNQLDFSLSLTPSHEPLDPLYEVLAAKLISETPDILARVDELKLVKSQFEAEDVERRPVAAPAIEALRDLHAESNALKEEREHSRRLKAQLQFLQSRLETQFKRMSKAQIDANAAVEQARTDTMALKAETLQLRHDVAALRTSASWRVTAPLRALSRFLRAPFRVKRVMAARRHAALVRNSSLFDASWYRQRYSDVANSNLDPALHYVRHGGQEGRPAGPNFDSAAYLKANPDVAASGWNPLVHYLLHGQRESRPLNIAGRG